LHRKILLSISEGQNLGCCWENIAPGAGDSTIEIQTPKAGLVALLHLSQSLGGFISSPAFEAGMK
jgi:hypothetical protein